MRDYQRHLNNKYILPTDVYKQTLEIIRGYYRMEADLKTILEEMASLGDGMPHGPSVSDPVASKASRRENMKRRIDIIDAALLEIPEEYRGAVWRHIGWYNVQTGKLDQYPWPPYADVSTYARWKSKLIYLVAERLELF